MSLLWALPRSLLYEFLRELESSAGATTGEQILSALRFLDGTARFSKIALDEILSARVRGLAQKMFLSKEPLKQRPPFEGLAGASSGKVCCWGERTTCGDRGSTSFLLSFGMSVEGLVEDYEH